MTPARRFAIFRILALLEVVAAIGSVLVIFDGSNGLTGLVLVVVLAHLYVAGFVVAVLGALAKPRQRLMLVSLVVHALIGLGLVAQWQLKEAASRSLREDVMRRRAQHAADRDAQ